MRKNTLLLSRPGFTSPRPRLTEILWNKAHARNTPPLLCHWQLQVQVQVAGSVGGLWVAGRWQGQWAGWVAGLAGLAGRLGWLAVWAGQEGKEAQNTVNCDEKWPQEACTKTL